MATTDVDNIRVRSNNCNYCRCIMPAPIETFHIPKNNAYTKNLNMLSVQWSSRKPTHRYE